MPLKEDREFNKTFAFFADLLAYSVRKAGLEWIMPDLEKDPEILKSRRFLPVMGDAVWLYREKYNDYLKEDIENNFRNLNSTTVLDFALNFAEKTFVDKNFVKEFFMFSAFMVNATLNFTLRGEEDYIDTLLWTTEDIYDIFMRRRFRGLGGGTFFKDMPFVASYTGSKYTPRTLLIVKQDSVSISCEDIPLGVLKNSQTLWSTFLFVEDMISHTMKFLSVKWKSSFCFHAFRERFETTFTSHIGGAVSLITAYFDTQLSEVTSHVTPSILADSRYFTKFVYYLADKIFSENVFLELVTFCSSVIYVAEHLCRQGHPEFLDYAVIGIGFVFENKLKYEFETQGSWPAFIVCCKELITARSSIFRSKMAELEKAALN